MARLVVGQADVAAHGRVEAVEVAGLAQVLGKEIRQLSHGYRQRVGLADALADALLAAPDVDLVVAGSRGQGAVARAPLGSVSDRLAHLCPKPILIVH